MGTYGLVSTAFALVMVVISSQMQVNRKLLHALSLTAGGLGFASMFVIKNPDLLHLSYAGIGIAWASILSMPYAMLSSAVPSQKIGIYMGLFNAFICIPQIIAALGSKFIFNHIIGDSTILYMVLSGCSLLLGAVATLFIKLPDNNAIPKV